MPVIAVIHVLALETLAYSDLYCIAAIPQVSPYDSFYFSRPVLLVSPANASNMIMHKTCLDL